MFKFSLGIIMVAKCASSTALQSSRRGKEIDFSGDSQDLAQIN